MAAQQHTNGPKNNDEGAAGTAGHDAPEPRRGSPPEAAPIAIDQRSLDDLLAAHPAAASPDWVLALEPNRLEDAIAGPHAQIDPNSYVHMKKPNGDDFLAPLSNVEYYEYKGFTAGKTEQIGDYVGYWGDKGPLTPTAQAQREPRQAHQREHRAREEGARARGTERQR